MINPDRISAPRLLVLPPRWALCVILYIGMIDPLSHAIIRHFPPAGAVPTDGHTVDSFNYLTGMRYAHAPWYSPYSLCSDEFAAGDPTLFAIPHHHLFGLVGTLGGWLHIQPFYTISLANGFCAAFYLYAVYCFLCLAVPRLAGRAFLLFSLGGGLGGLLYVLTWPFGVHEAPTFGEYFLRYFIYELSEGPRFQPWLMAARLYYTFAFGFAFLGLATFWRGLTFGRHLDLVAATALFAITTFLNFRAGPMLWVALAIIAVCHEAWPWRRRIVWTGVVLIGTLTGAAAAWWMVSRNPQLVESVARSQRTALWFSPIVSATFFYWMILPGALARSANRARGLLRSAAWIGLAYVAVFATLYVLYQAYYGNFLRTGEFQVAVLMSDWALAIAVPLGLSAAWWAGRTLKASMLDVDNSPAAFASQSESIAEMARLGAPAARRQFGTDVFSSEPVAPIWATLWLLLFLCLSISAWGQGWFLRFTPDRFVIVIGVPLAILGAAAIERGMLRWPRYFHATQCAILLGGVLSILVTWLVSYGPLGYHTLQRHYSWTRNAFMNQADADTLAHLGEGVVLAPSLGAPLMGDLAVLRGNPTVYGIGSLDYTRHVVTSIRSEVAEFFAPKTPEAWRREKAEEWCIRYVYCPDTDPVNPDTVAQLRACAWLREVAGSGSAVLFKVNKGLAG